MVRSDHLGLLYQLLDVSSVDSHKTLDAYIPGRIRLRELHKGGRLAPCAFHARARYESHQKDE